MIGEKRVLNIWLTLLGRVGLLLIASLFAAGFLAAQQPPRPIRPNIVLILADDLSYRDLSAWGQVRFSTPNLDRLALEGLRFTQAYAGAPECAPSRGTLMTGLHTGHASIRDNRSARGQDHLLDSDITIAEVLKQSGYATGFFGKWGIGLPGTPGTPDRQGFDEAFGFYDQRRAHTFFPFYLYRNGRKVDYPGNNGFDMLQMYEDNRTPPGERNSACHYDGSGRLIPPGIAEPSKAVYSEDVLEDAAVSFVRRNRDRPFFLYFATQLPHGPVVTDSLGPLLNRTDFPTTAHKEWASMVLRIDTFAGELVDLLVDLGIRNRTLLVFASDNGYSMCGYFARGNQNANWPDDPFFRNKGPFRGGKFSLLEGGIRIPFFVNWPAEIPSGASSVPVWLLDLHPTFAELGGVLEVPETDGWSLVPIWTGDVGSFPSDRPLYWENAREQAVRMGPWKAYRPSPAEPLELFLIEEDVGCERDLSGVYPQVVAVIETIMEREHVDHPWYWNPGETIEDFRRKEALAEELGQLQVARQGNAAP